MWRADRAAGWRCRGQAPGWRRTKPGCPGGAQAARRGPSSGAGQVALELDSSVPPRCRLTGGPAQVHTSRVTGADALDAFLRALAARGASPHTLRAYQTAVEQYLGWLEEHGQDWRA